MDTLLQSECMAVFGPTFFFRILIGPIVPVDSQSLTLSELLSLAFISKSWV
jgi:hypothetical protein